MKKIIFSCCLVGILSSCTKNIDSAFISNFEVHNMTSQPVKFIKHTGDFTDTIVLDNSSIISGSFSSESYDFYPFQNSDSIEIVFNNGKIKIDVNCLRLSEANAILCNHDSLNIFKQENYSSSQVNNNTKLFVYNISEKDSIEAK